MRLLFLRGGALGDFIVTLPALHAARAHWPEAHLALVGNARAAALASRPRGRAPLDEIHDQHAARWAPLHDDGDLPGELAMWLRTFTAIACFWPDPDRCIARHLGALGIHHVMAPALPVCAPASAHYLHALAGLGVPAPPDLQSRLHLSPADRASAESALGDWAGGGFVVLHPGSGSTRKNWSPERWRELATQLLATGRRVLVTAGEADAAGRAALATLDGLHWDPGWSLATLAAVLAKARMFVGHDSGVSHLAAAVGTPCLLLFGPTDPAVWAPVGDHVQVVAMGRDPDTLPARDVRARFDAFCTSRPRDRD